VEHDQTGGATDRHTQGILLIVIPTVAYSSTVLFTRLVHLSARTTLFTGLMIPCVILVQKRGMSRNGNRRSSRRRGGTVLDRRATILRVTAFRRTR